jgi:hypothetical protein
VLAAAVRGLEEGRALEAAGHVETVAGVLKESL